MNLNQSIIKIRVDLQNSTIKKSGKNKHAGFSYYELSDFLPKLNELMLENGINDIVSINNELASITLVKDAERETYSIPFIMFDTPLANSGKKMMQDIQYLGALNTYLKRYLYLNAFGITDGEVIDSMDNTKVKKDEPKGNDGAKISLHQIDIIQGYIKDGKIDSDKMKSYFKVNAINELSFSQAKKAIAQGEK